MRKVQLFFFIVFTVSLSDCEKKDRNADFSQVFGYYQSIHKSSFNVTKNVEDSISNFLACYNKTSKFTFRCGDIHYRYFIGGNDLTYKREEGFEVKDENATGIIFKETLDDPSLGRLMDSIVFIGNQNYMQKLKLKASEIGFSYVDTDSIRMSYFESWYVNGFPMQRLYLLTFKNNRKLWTATLTYGI